MKSRMREIFKYGSVRGLRHLVGYDGDRSTRHEEFIAYLEVHMV